MDRKIFLERIPSEKVPEIREVLDFAFLHLSPLQRRTGENYAEHGLLVASTFCELGFETSMVKVAILHDLFLHPQAEVLLDSSPLNEDERVLARQMHQLRRLFIDSRTQDLDKFIHSFIKDERLLPLRMAHRLSDVRRLDRFQPDLRKQIAHETLHMYTAIARRLGMHAWAQEMEDLCFSVVHPAIAKRLAVRFEKLRLADESCLEETKKFLEAKLKDQEVECRIEGRIKGLYSTYQKMRLKRRRFEALTDRLAIRIVVKNYMDCYKALGVVHAFMHPIPGKLKDYIGAPKENGYQSIHTVVFPLTGVNKQPIEIQIRTGLMDEVCEYGPAAHADYKKQKYAMATNHTRVNLFRNLAQLHQLAETPQQFERVLRRYFDNGHMAIFDGEDNLYHVKRPTTAIDFVSHAFPNRFKQLKLIRINGQVVESDVSLKDGDVVSPEFAVGANRLKTPRIMRITFKRPSSRIDSVVDDGVNEEG